MTVGILGLGLIGGHPMAGTQFSGFKYSRADLFHGAPMVLVPPRFDDMDPLDRAKKALAPAASAPSPLQLPGTMTG